MRFSRLAPAYNMREKLYPTKQHSKKRDVSFRDCRRSETGNKCIRDGVENPVSYLGPFKRDRCADLLRHETALPRALPLIIAPAWPLCAPLHEYTPPNDAHTTQYSGRLFFAGENEMSRSFRSPLKRPDWIGSSGMCRPSFYGGSKSGELRAVVSNAFERG